MRKIFDGGSATGSEAQKLGEISEMLKILNGFLRGLLSLAWPWWIWVALLGAVNMVAPLFFLQTAEARVVLAAFLVAASFQMGLFAQFGFVRLLGIGHILPWLPMLIWLASRLDGINAASPLGRWVLAVLVLDAISLVIDAVDVIRYAAGDRTPSVTA